jgi:hypothetical protein
MANKVYQHDETAIVWKSSGGDHAFTPTSLATAAGRQGAYHDFDTSARAALYAWRMALKPGGTRVVGEIIRVYWITSDGTSPDNDDGTGDIAVSALDKLRNVDQIGTIQIDENAAVVMVGHGVIEVTHRYGAPAIWNATANTLSATAGDYIFTLTPIPPEIQ